MFINQTYRKRLALARAKGSKRNGLRLVERYKLPVIRGINSGSVMYNIRMMVNNTVYCVLKGC